MARANSELAWSSPQRESGIDARKSPISTPVVGRYYDPSTDQFLSVDPDVMETGQPYAFTGDDPLNATDPLGLRCLPKGVEGPCGPKPKPKHKTARHNGPRPITQSGKLNPKSLKSQKVLTYLDDSSGGDIAIAGGGSSVHVVVVDQGADGAEFGIFGTETVSLCNLGGPGGCATRFLARNGDAVEFNISAADESGYDLTPKGSVNEYRLGLTISAPPDVNQLNAAIVGSSGGLRDASDN